MPNTPQPPSPWCLGDDPLPDSNDTLIDQIKRYAAARRRDALFHQGPCSCPGCEVRKYHQARSTFTRRAV